MPRIYVNGRWRETPDAPTTPLSVYQQALDAVGARGAVERKRLEEYWGNQRNQGIADLYSRGMAGGGLAFSGLKSMMGRGYSQALESLNASLAEERAKRAAELAQFQFQQQKFGHQRSMDVARLNLAQNQGYGRRYPSRGGYGSAGFQEVPSTIQTPLPGSTASLYGNRAYIRANRLYG